MLLGWETRVLGDLYVADSQFVSIGVTKPSTEWPPGSLGAFLNRRETVLHGVDAVSPHAFERNEAEVVVDALTGISK